MKNPMRVYVFVMIVAAILTIMIVLIALIPYFKANQYGHKPSETEFWVQYVGIIIATTSLVAVTFTIGLQIIQLINQREDSKKNFLFAAQNYDTQVLTIIDKFLSESFEKTRERCWVLMADLKTDPKATSEIQTIFTQNIKNDWGVREAAKTSFSDERFKDYKEFIRLVRYFDLMSRYEFSTNTVLAIHYYYIFYRKFFIQMSEIYKIALNNIPQTQRLMHALPSWLDLVDRMDSKVRAFNLPLQ